MCSTLAFECRNDKNDFICLGRIGDLFSPGDITHMTPKFDHIFPFCGLRKIIRIYELKFPPFIIKLM